MLFVGLAAFAQDGTTNKNCEKKGCKKECSNDLQSTKKCDPKDCKVEMGCKNDKEKSCKKSCSANANETKRNATTK